MALEAKFNILLIDDYKPARLRTKKLLEDTGFLVFPTPNGKKAIQTILNKKNYEIVVMDVGEAPFGNHPYGLIFKIRRMMPETLVIGQTAWRDLSVYRKDAEEYFDGLYSKFQDNILGTRILKTLEKKSKSSIYLAQKVVSPYLYH
ncbi:response regulator [Candidatus Pacearchaeota archaeon]|nr:response regulator [Candidatus Pacearchaeota archaeon]